MPVERARELPLPPLQLLLPLPGGARRGRREALPPRRLPPFTSAAGSGCGMAASGGLERVALG